MNVTLETIWCISQCAILVKRKSKYENMIIFYEYTNAKFQILLN